MNAVNWQRMNVNTMLVRAVYDAVIGVGTGVFCYVEG